MCLDGFLLRNLSTGEQRKKLCGRHGEWDQTLKVLEVGNDILQFKFPTQFQLDWVLYNSPGSFENNLLLLCKWEKGLSSHNMSLSHMTFWIQVWGLQFEMLSEEAGADIRNRIGRFISND